MRISDWSSDVCSSDLPVTVAVSLADKLDTLATFYIIGEQPTGSKDPFALRRAAIGAIALIIENGLRFRLGGLLSDYILGVSARKSLVEGKRVAVRVDLGGRRNHKKKKNKKCKQ